MNQAPDFKPAGNLLGHAATGCYLLLAAVTLAWGAYKRLHIPQAPIVDPDIRGYLGPALVALSGKPFLISTAAASPTPPSYVSLSGSLETFAPYRSSSISLASLPARSPCSRGTPCCAWRRREGFPGSYRDTWALLPPRFTSAPPPQFISSRRFGRRRSFHSSRYSIYTSAFSSSMRGLSGAGHRPSGLAVLMSLLALSSIC